MKKLTGLTCFILLVLLINAYAPLFIAVAVDPLLTDGDGTSEDPYIISDKIQLKYLSEYPDAFFRLDANLVFSDEDFEPGGAFYREESNGPRFSEFHGNLDGGGHTISGYRLDVYFNTDESAYYTAMFGDNHGTIKNLKLVDLVYDLNEYQDLSTDIRFTSLAVNNHGTIENCTIASIVAFDFLESGVHTVTYGGFALNNHGLIEGCGINTDVYVSSNSANIGGVASVNFGDIKKCYNSGIFTLNVSALSAGGIAVTNDGNGIIEECYNNGYVFSGIGYPDIKVGGIAAENTTENNLIQNCFNTGTIYIMILDITDYSGAEKAAFAGGIAGKNGLDATILNCYNSGVVSEVNLNNTFKTDIGGIAGYNDGKINAVAIDDGIPAVPSTGNPDNAVLKSVEEMKSIDAYEGFDFTSIFTFLPEDNDKDFYLPVLQNTPFEFEKKVAGAVVTNLPDTLKRYTEDDLSDDNVLTPDTLKEKGLEVCYRYNNTDIETTPAEIQGIRHAPLMYGPNIIYAYLEYDGYPYVAAYTIEVIPTSLSSVEIDPLFVKTDYIIGIDEVFDISGAVLQLNYLDGTTRTIPLIDDYLVDDVSQILDIPGIQKPVNIDYYGYKTVLYINVYNSSIQSDVHALHPSADEEHDAYIRVAPGTTVHQLLSTLYQKNYITVMVGDSEITGDTELSTGAKLVLAYNDTVLDTVGVAVAGDLNNNGAVTITDLVLLRGYLLGLNTLSELPFLAADLNDNGSLTVTDLIFIRSYLLGMSQIG